jgi:hypothetical protein
MNINDGFAIMQSHFCFDAAYIDVDNTDITF